MPGIYPHIVRGSRPPTPRIYVLACRPRFRKYGLDKGDTGYMNAICSTPARSCAPSRLWGPQQPKTDAKKVKIKGMSICTAPIHETSLRRSGIARIVKGYHSFTCTPCVSSASGMSHTCLCLPRHSWYSFTDPGGMEGCVDLGAKWPRPRFEPATSRLQIRHSTT